MNFPNYQLIQLKTGSHEEIQQILNPEMNLRRPVAISLKTLGLEQQREVTGLIENYFESADCSCSFPYPIYLITDQPQPVGNLPFAFTQEDLPKFFTQKETKVAMKEAQILGRNKLLQQEIKNADPVITRETLKNYAQAQKELFRMHHEFLFLSKLEKKLTAQEKSNGRP